MTHQTRIVVLTGFTVPLVAAAAVLALALVGGSFANQSSVDESSRQTATPSLGEAGAEVSVVTSGLEAPWGLAFTPSGGALVTERDSRRLLWVDPSGAVEEVWRMPAGESEEGALLGITLSPSYESDGLVYAWLWTGSEGRVVRFRLDERAGGVVVAENEKPETVLGGIPADTRYHGGRIEFGPDGMLYVATGDTVEVSTGEATGDDAQDLGSLAGKILRVAPDGSVPSNNPFPGSPVWSSGHRNPQGLAWDARGRLYAAELGDDVYDEVNRIERGGNYGWPHVEGKGGEDQGYVDPITTFAPSEASPSGATFLVSGAMSEWEGNLFVAGLRGERLWRLVLDEDGNVAEREELLQDEADRLRNVAQAPDGSLWVLTSNRDGRRDNPDPEDDRILRIGPPSRG